MADDLPDAPWATGEALPDAPWASSADKQPVSPISKALEPITSYPETYSTINKEAREQMSHGVDQLSSPSGAMDVAKGAGNVGLGALNYVTSPISAGLRTVVGKPIEENTGIPKEYSEFAASLAIPGMGLRSAAASDLGKATKIAAPSREALKEAAEEGFNTAKSSGISIPSEHVTSLAQSARSSLEQEGFRDYLAPKTFAVLSELEKPPAGVVTSVADLHGIRRVLGKAASSADPTEQAASSRVISSLDSYLSQVSPELKDAIKNYGAMKRSEGVQTAAYKADLSADAAHSGQNIDNATRQRFKSILLSPKAKRGYSDKELAQMENVVRGSYTGDAMRFLGNMLGGGGGLGSTVAASAGSMAAGPAGATAPLVGFAAKKLANLSTARNVKILDEMVRSRSPLANKEAEVAATRDLANRWVKAYAASQTRPNAGTAKLLNTTSRGLSLALNRNLGIDAQKALQSLQGTVPSAADQQPQQ